MNTSIDHLDWDWRADTPNRWQYNIVLGGLVAISATVSACAIVGFYTIATWVLG